VAGFYEAVLGLGAAAIALAATVLIAAWQFVADKVTLAVASLIRTRKLVWLGAALLLAGFATSLVGSLLLSSSHDFLPGRDLGSNAWLEQPGFGLITALSLVLGAMAVFVSVARSLALLNYVSAGRALLKRFRCQTWRQFLIAGLDPAVESEDIVEAARGLNLDLITATLLKDRALADRQAEFGDPSHTEFALRIRDRARRRTETVAAAKDAMRRNPRNPLADIVEVASRATATAHEADGREVLSDLLEIALACFDSPVSPGLGAEEIKASMSHDLFAVHFRQLVDQAIEAGRLDIVPGVGDLVTRALERRNEKSLWADAQELAARAARRLLATRSSRPLAALVSDLADHAVLSLRLVEPERESRFRFACSTLGFLGEQIPALFRDPGSPEILFPSEEMTTSDPLDALYESFDEIQDRAFPQGMAAVDALGYVEAVERSAQALSDRIVKYYRDGRLELQLVHFAALLGRLAIDSAKQRDARTSFVAAVALSRLAESANQDYYREYPQDLAMDLTGVGLLAEQHDLAVPGMGSIAEWVAKELVDELPDELDHAMREALMAGQFSYVDQDTRGRFIRRVAERSGRNFGLNL
jgi:hypothetical protein